MDHLAFERIVAKRWPYDGRRLVKLAHQLFEFYRVFRIIREVDVHAGLEEDLARARVVPNDWDELDRVD
ncbi:hypothetical protein ACVWXO_005788 [Bradyrhizobium sp. LM2.7]